MLINRYANISQLWHGKDEWTPFTWNTKTCLLSGVPDYFGRNKISSGGDLSHYSSVSLY